MPKADDVAKPHADANQMDSELVDIETLVLDDRNARRGDVGAVVASLREFGQHRPAVVQRSTRKVIAGNHMVKAADLLGWTKINVVWVDDDDRAAVRRAIADNAVADKAKWDDDVLRSLLQEVGDAPLPGLDDRTVSKLLNEIEKEKPAEPVYPIVPKVGEKYDYVLVVASNEVDATWLAERFGLRRERSYKSQNVGLSRVVSVERLRVEWGELPDPDAGPDDDALDHAPA